MNTAAPSSRSGPRTSGLDSVSVPRSIARKPRAARRRTARATAHARTSVGTSASTIDAHVTWSANTRDNMPGRIADESG